MNAIALLFASLIATSAMIAFMGWIRARRWANADMVRALGSLATRSEANAFGPGLVLQYSGGAMFALVYGYLLTLAPLRYPLDLVGFSAVMGLAHGVVIGVLLAFLIAEHHPLARFRVWGGGVVISYLIGHLIYGTVFGATLASFKTGIFAARESTSIESLSLWTVAWMAVCASPAIALIAAYAPWKRGWITQATHTPEETGAMADSERTRAA